MLHSMIGRSVPGGHDSPRQPTQERPLLQHPTTHATFRQPTHYMLCVPLTVHLRLSVICGRSSPSSVVPAPPRSDRPAPGRASTVGSPWGGAVGSAMRGPPSMSPAARAPPAPRPVVRPCILAAGSLRARGLARGHPCPLARGQARPGARAGQPPHTAAAAARGVPARGR